MAGEIDIPASAWEDAYRKADAYLAALGTSSIVLRQALTRELTAVVGKKLAEDGRTPAAITMDELEEKLLAWMRRIFPLSETDREEAILRGYLALLLAAMAGRPYDLLSEELSPEGSVKKIQVVPELCRGTMAKHPLDLGLVPRFMEVFLNTVAQDRRFLILVWGVVMTSLALLFYYLW